MTHTYIITGMTCSGCANKVKGSLLTVPNVSGVVVDQLANTATVTMDQHVSLSDLQNALSNKYQIAAAPDELKEETPSFFKTYRPVLLLLAYITLISIIASWQNQQINWMLLMRFFMAGFFLAFSFFKLINLNGFAESYAMYDIVAKKFKAWGYIYAFLELFLGVAFLIDFNPQLTNSITLVLMSVSIIGVLQSVLNQKRIQCACLGAVFNLPMSTLTIIEDFLMIAMSATMLILM